MTKASELLTNLAQSHQDLGDSYLKMASLMDSDQWNAGTDAYVKAIRRYERAWATWNDAESNYREFTEQQPYQKCAFS
jgi:hypothetical protein